MTDALIFYYYKYVNRISVRRVYLFYAVLI